MPFVFLQVGIAQRTDFVPLKFQDLLCVVTVEKEKLKRRYKIYPNIFVSSITYQLDKKYNH